MRAARPPSSNTPPNKAAPPDCLPGRTFLGSAGLGFVLGAVVWRGPIYSLEIAQVAAGRVVLPPLHPIYAHHTSVLSPFLVQIPAVLLRLGVPDYVLCVVMSGIVAALAFAAVSVCAWAFSHDRILTLAAPVLFLAFYFVGHKYPLFFPVGEHDTGIAGFFVALLAASRALVLPEPRRSAWDSSPPFIRRSPRQYGLGARRHWPSCGRPSVGLGSRGGHGCSPAPVCSWWAGC